MKIIGMHILKLHQLQLVFHYDYDVHTHQDHHKKTFHKIEEKKIQEKQESQDRCMMPFSWKDEGKKSKERNI